MLADTFLIKRKTSLFSKSRCTSVICKTRDEFSHILLILQFLGGDYLSLQCCDVLSNKESTFLQAVTTSQCSIWFHS